MVHHKSHLGRFLAAQTPQCTSEVFGSVGLSPGHLRFTSSLGGFDGQPSESASHRESGLVALQVWSLDWELLCLHPESRWTCRFPGSALDRGFAVGVQNSAA